MAFLRASFRDTVVLMYHRISDHAPDPGRMCVSPERFEAHLEVLRARCEIVPADAIGGARARRAVVLTFDDGYADNLHVAKPLLAKHSANATVFVTTGYVGAEREFWWDELEQLLLAPGSLPERLDLRGTEAALEFSFERDASYSAASAAQHLRWAEKHDGRAPPSERHALYRILTGALLELAEPSRDRLVARLFDWAGRERAVRESHRPLDASELRKLVAGDVFRVGSHGVSHRPLAGLDDATLRSELSDSRGRLEEILGRPAEDLAYPNSRYDSRTLSIAKSAGYERAFCGRRVLHRFRARRYQIPRLPVKNWSRDDFERRLAAAFAR